MLVFWDQRLVFLATPKTGSTAIAAALEPLAALSVQRPPVLKHTTARRYHRFIGPYLSAASGARFTTVALMREPLDWLGSWYRFRRREDIQDERMRTSEMSFDAFAQAYCRQPQPGFANVGAQARFLAPDGQPGVDRIFRYEAMDRFVAFLEDRLDCALVLPTLNVSPEASVDLAPGTLAALRRTMAADFALYGTLD
ncbi:MAG: hypothetical protein ACK4OP_02465 [Gemmobacter sp.]